jgi:transcriptional regulator with XRE-family HTH domain
LESMAPTLLPDPSLAEALLELRKARGLSQESVSHGAEITLGAYGRIERIEVAPNWMTVRAIARSLGVSMGELGAAVDARERR